MIGGPVIEKAPSRRRGFRLLIGGSRIVGGRGPPNATLRVLAVQHAPVDGAVG
jgi:hypothetical protein